MPAKALLQIVAAGLLVCGSANGDVFTNVPGAASYQLVYTLPVPAIQGNYNTGTIPYTVNNAASFPGGSFTRVAYYLELSGSTDPTRKNG